MRRGLLFFAGLLTLLNTGFCQERTKGEIDRGFMMNLHTSNRGYGLELNYLIGPNDQQYVIGLGFSTIKDLREILVDSFYGNEQGKRYVYGKLNYFGILSPTVGISRNILPLNDLNLINVRGIIRAGPALGLLSPYYLEIFKPNPNSPFVGEREVEAYNPIEHTYSKIVGKANLLSSELDVNMKVGLTVQAQAVVDFSRSSRYISGVSLGLSSHVFFNDVPIMADLGGKINNQQLFLSGNLGIIFGNRW